MASDVTRRAPIGSLVKIRAEKEPPRPVPIKRVGKRGKAWLRFRNDWIKENPPDYLGNYECQLCGRPVPKSIMQLDHVLKRGANPHLVLEKTNVRPVCPECNFKRET